MMMSEQRETGFFSIALFHKIDFWPGF